MSCERYFIELPPQEPLTPESLLEESLALVYPKDIYLHRTVFLVPFEPSMLVKMEKKRLWSKSQRKFEYNPATVLRNNIKFMIKKTKHFGLLLSQFTWVGLLNLAEKRHVLQHYDEDLRAAALYILLLKKESSGLTQFINCLHMTGNHEIANVIEAKLDLLEHNIGSCEQYGHCTPDERTDSCDESHVHYVPPKKRKTSADSGFDDSDDDPEMESSFAAAAAAAAISSMNGYGRRKFKCNIRPLDAVDVIAIINGKEDSRSKVELCRCGNYHQYPKWKDVNSSHASILAKENSFVMKSDAISSGTLSASSSSTLLSSSTVAGGLAKYFSRRNSSFSSSSSSSDFIGSKQQPQKQGILSPVGREPLEVGLDLSHGMPDNLEFTKPRRSCSHLRLRFGENSFAEHPDNIQTVADSSQGSKDANVDSLLNKLPRFLRLFL